MSYQYFAISIAYVAISVVFGVLELHRIRKSGPDVITIFVVIFMLQCCLPGIGIYAALPLAGTTNPTENPVFDMIFQRLDLTTALTVLALTIWFFVFVYVGASAGRVLIRRLLPHSMPATYRLEGIKNRLVVTILGGLALTLISFYFIGDDLVERYANLIRLRAYSEEVERTELNAYAFALTQTWGWLSIPALFVLADKRRVGFILVAFIACAVVFAVLGASRRGIFIPVLLCYFTFLLYDGKWRVRLICALMIPIVVWIAFGKEILILIAFGGGVGDLTDRYESTASAVLRANSEQGITIVESLGTLAFLSDYLRLGVDHLLSIAHRFPYRMLGFDIDFPKRMVRISTEAFYDPDAQDVPPGLFGQMWVDFRVFGPVIWGAFIGIQLSAAQFLFERCERSLQSSAVLALAVFLIALPINTGSYDFTFAIDVIVTVAALLLTFRLHRVSIAKGMRGGAAI